MIYFFFLSSLITSFLFVSPTTIYAPFQKGVSLFFLHLSLYSFWKTRNEEQRSKLRRAPSTNLFSFLKYDPIKSLPFFVLFSGLFFILTSTYHAYHLTKFFANSYLFHDADYVGLSDVLLSFWSGDGYKSHYYSNAMNGSYLEHHFAPGMMFLSPFVALIPNRLGLAVGVFFFYQLTTVLWLFWAYRLIPKDNKKIPVKFLVFWVLLTNQMYLYRIGSSYHFEILVVFFGFFYFVLWEKSKTIFSETQINRTKIFFWLCLSLLVFLLQKEDVGIYLLLFLFPAFLYHIFRSYQSTGKLDPFSFHKNQSLYLIFVMSIITMTYLVFVFFLYPFLHGSDSFFSWSKVLQQEYHVSFKQVSGVSKSIQMYLELLASAGLGVFQLIPELLGISFIYLTHVFSNRPWHHEVYSYYSYSLIPFVLYTGILWIKSKKEIQLPLAYLILACLFWKNSLDPNFPLGTEKPSTWYDPIIQSEVTEDLTRANALVTSDANQFSEVVSEIDKIVFSQYNLSFFITDKARLYPLEHLQNQSEICNPTNVCYVVIAPNFTNPTLWPKSRILDYLEKINLKQDQKIWQGKQIEVWALRK